MQKRIIFPCRFELEYARKNKRFTYVLSVSFAGGISLWTVGATPAFTVGRPFSSFLSFFFLLSSFLSFLGSSSSFFSDLLWDVLDFVLLREEVAGASSGGTSGEAEEGVSLGATSEDDLLRADRGRSEVGLDEELGLLSEGSFDEGAGFDEVVGGGDAGLDEGGVGSGDLGVGDVTPEGWDIN